MPMQYNWQKLSPHDFAQLQELTSTSVRRLKDVLRELEAGGSLAQLNPVEPTNFEGFKKFLSAYLGPEVPDAVCKHLFLSFVIKPNDGDCDVSQVADANSNSSPNATGNANNSNSSNSNNAGAGAGANARRSAGNSESGANANVSTSGNSNSMSATASRIWQRISSLSNPALHVLAVNNGTSPKRSPSSSVFARATATNRDQHKYASIGAGAGSGSDSHSTPSHSRSFHNLQTLRVTSNNAALTLAGKQQRERTHSNPNVARVDRSAFAIDVSGTAAIHCTCPECAFKSSFPAPTSTSQSTTISSGVVPGASGSGSGSLSFARWWRLRERDRDKEKHQRASALSAAHYAELLKQELEELEHGRIYLKDLICYLSLLEAGTPDEKLEFCFRLYDADSNGLLDSKEIECIVNQMMAVAEYLGWDVSELRPILVSMMSEIDLDSDGNVSLDEWVRGGLTTVPLLVLLGIDENIRDDGTHVWRLKHFQRQTFCNVCRTALGGIRKQGLCCSFCKYSVHQRCAQTAAQNCIRTYTKSRKEVSGPMAHHWIEGNYRGKCDRCGKTVRPASNTPAALRCRWCQLTIHDKCKATVKDACDFGRLRELILPPTAVLPGVLERRGVLPTKRSGDAIASGIGGILGAGISQQSLVSSVNNSSATTPTGNSSQPTAASIAAAAVASSGGHALAERLASGAGGASSLQIQLDPTPGGHRPLFVFVNPKSGGRQGARILRKLQCLMNPRQVFDMTRAGEPLAGLHFFRDVSACRVLCAGGDGTVGWLLDAMDRIEWTVGRPPVAVLPLGTGNDLARCLRWGGGYRDGESLTKLLDRIRPAEPLLLDRWHIDLVDAPVTKEERDRERERECERDRALRGSSFAEHENDADETANENERTSGVHSVSADLGDRERDRPTTAESNASVDRDRELQSDPIPFTIINNYFSIGLDASIAHRFHTMRERHPERFKSRMRNKVFYFEFATSEAFLGTCRNLHQFVDVECDGVPLDLAHGPPLEAITLVNIPSIYGGSNLWGTSNAVSIASHRHAGHSSASINVHFTQQDVGDRLIEVVGIESIFHTAQLKAGLRSSGRRLAQCHQVTIRTRKRFPMQIDGEPWMQAPCFIHIRHKNQVPMLAAPIAEKKFKGLLGWFNKKRSGRSSAANANASGIASDEPTNTASSSSASNSVDG